MRQSTSPQRYNYRSTLGVLSGRLLLRGAGPLTVTLANLSPITNASRGKWGCP
jgi:hypothetical protein